MGQKAAGRQLCRDLWSGAEFLLLPGDDVVRELAEACHLAGLRFGLYYS